MNKSQNCKGIIRFTLKIRMILYLVGAIICLLTFFSCERNTTPFTQTPAHLTLSAEYVAVTEAWLQVNTENISENHQLKVWRDTTVVFNGIINTADTTVYDSALLPAHNYAYHAAIVKNGTKLVESLPLKITTMDTTSHDFTWETFTFGTGASSELNDVAIINENDLWAVGEIYADTVQPWLPYNAVHWDGQQWELKRINFYLCPNGTSPTPYPIQAIFAFSEDDIWFTRGASFVHWNGNEFTHDCSMNSIIDGSIQKIWGTSSQDLYAVGYNGTIIQYNGSSWQKIESGTTDIINDIYGIRNEQSNDYKILCAVGDVYGEPNGQILAIESDLSITDFPWPEQTKIHSVWVKNDYLTYACGAGIWRHQGTNWKKYEGVTGAFWRRIRGNADNDIFTCGDFGYVSHFNGQTWRSYQFNQISLPISLDVKDDLVVIVSYDGANVIVGRRGN